MSPSTRGGSGWRPIPAPWSHRDHDTRGTAGAALGHHFSRPDHGRADRTGTVPGPYRDPTGTLPGPYRDQLSQRAAAGNSRRRAAGRTAGRRVHHPVTVRPARPNRTLRRQGQRSAVAAAAADTAPLGRSELAAHGAQWAETAAACEINTVFFVRIPAGIPRR